MLNPVDVSGSQAFGTADRFKRELVAEFAATVAFSAAMNNDKFKGEDAGFAINGGKGWKEVVFDNHQIELNADTAVAMGSYDFTCATTGDVATVEYTFGYKRNDDGKARIFLHHSSVPYEAK